jgi:hypothetical protein
MPPAACSFIYVGFHCLSLHVSAYTAIFRCVGFFVFILLYLRILLRCLFTWSHSACFPFVFCSCAVFLRVLGCFLAYALVCLLGCFPAFYGTRRFNTEFTRVLHLSLSSAYGSWFLESSAHPGYTSMSPFIFPADGRRPDEFLCTLN